MPHIAGSLVELRLQLDVKYPHRSKVSDGILPDARHVSTGKLSDHNAWWVNPNTGDGVYRAFDITHDPSNGVDGFALSRVLITDSRVNYVIYNRQINDRRNQKGWVSYTGSDPHTSHVHVSVVAAPLCESPAEWRLDTGMYPVLSRGSQGAAVAELQTVLSRWYPSLHLAVDGQFGPATEAAVKYYQVRAHLTVDGIAGPLTLRGLSIL